jgi:hypothetical protein
MAMKRTTIPSIRSVDLSLAGLRLPAGSWWRLAIFLLLGLCHGERTGLAHVVPGGLDPAVGALDVHDAELVDMAVDGVGDAAHMPSDAKGS